mgnify:CR=1 FL=1
MFSLLPNVYNRITLLMKLGMAMPQELAPVISRETSERNSHEQRHENCNARKARRNREFRENYVADISSSLSEARPHVSLEEIGHISDIALPERLVQSVFCGKCFLSRLAHRLLSRERTARYQIHQKKSQCCNNEYAQQTHCNTLDDILRQVCQLPVVKVSGRKLCAAP